MRKFPRKLQSIGPKLQSQDNFTDSIKMLTDCIYDLKKELQCLSQRTETISQQNSKTDSNILTQTDEVQVRFKNINMEIPSINIKSEGGVQKLKIWLGEMCKRIFSLGFKFFQKKKLNEKTAKIFCCQNMIYCLVQLIRKNNFKESQMKIINQCLQNDLLPYFFLKYPQSEEDDVNLVFASTLNEIDNLESNENDLLFRSGKKFKFSQSKEYNSQIMDFLNYIIDLPQKQIIQKKGNFQSSKKETIYETFHKDMQSLFQQVQNEETAIKMHDFDRSSLEGSEKSPFLNFFLNNFKSKKEPTKDQHKYREEVKSYTNCLIGRKISKNIPTFTQKQIKEGILKIRSPSLMRILTKWCEELEKNYHHILEREEPFRMLDGSQKFLSHSDQIILSKILEKQKKKIDGYLQSVMENNFEHQTSLSKSDIFKNFHLYTEFQGKVGITSSFIFQNNQSYLIGYMNALIHGLLTASQTFKSFVKVRGDLSQRQISQICNSEINIEEFIHFCEQKNEEEEDEWEQNLKQIPQLITFKIGDLLRCKCSSKEYEITALYNEIQKISFFNPNLLKIVRIKNRLKKGTKDVLINFMYKNTMLVEMQLSIKSNKSKFIEYSSKFGHFIYEVQRSQFGPFSEMCNIWMTNDPRGSFYNTKMKEINLKQGFNFEPHKCSGEENQIYLPFQCQICKYYYSEVNYNQRHVQCLSCFKKICFACKIREVDDYQKIREILPQLPPQAEGENYDVFSTKTFQVSEFPKKGIVFNLLSKQVKGKKFKRMKRNNKKLLFTSYVSNDQTKFEQIADISSKDLLKQFLKSHLVISSNSIDRQVSNITKESVEINYFIPQFFNQAIKKGKESITLNRQGMTDEVFMKVKKKNKIFHKVKKISFIQNRLKDTMILGQLFPNLKIAVLSYNKIQNIAESFLDLTKIQHLYLGYNNLSTLPAEIYQWKELKVLDLCYNSYLQELPNSFVELSNLEDLNLQSTIVRRLPENIDKCKKLKKINLSSIKKFTKLPQKITYLSDLQELILFSTGLRELPKAIGNCQNLIKLQIQGTQITEIPESVGKLQKLDSLDLSHTNLQYLPKSIQKLKKLGDLDLSYTIIKQIPDDLQSLTELYSLAISGTPILKVPQFLNKFENLQELFIQKNPQIQNLPKEICQCKKLSILDLSETSISNLPEEMKNLENLKQLNISLTFIEEIPKFIGNWKLLQTLLASGLSITEIPQTIGNCEHLIILNVSQTQLQKFPQNLKNCRQLIYLLAEQTKVTKIPSYFGKFSWLRNLNLSKNLITYIPESIGFCSVLIQLHLNDTLITELPESLKNLKQLRTLQINNTKIKKFPQQICHLIKLQTLSANGNQLTQLPPVFNKLYNLTKLKLNNNCFETIPKPIMQLTKLQSLSIAQNEIKEIPEQLSNLKKLNILNIEKNKLPKVPTIVNQMSELCNFIFGKQVQSTNAE